jgi:hypothetical protein
MNILIGAHQTETDQKIQSNHIQMQKALDQAIEKIQTDALKE